MAAIKAMKPYIKHAQELDKFEPVLAYFCRFYAVQVGVAINQKTPDPEAKQQLISLLTRLESDKKNLATQLENLDKQGPQGRLEFVESFALRVFDKADQDDRAGIATNATALSFYSAIHFFEILKQFYDNGELPPEILERQKYAKWKAVYIKQCLKQGITPKPGPADSGEEENLENGEGQEGLNGTGGEVTEENRGMMDDAGHGQHQVTLDLPSPPTVLQPPPQLQPQAQLPPQSQPQLFSAFPQPPQSSPQSSPATGAAQPHIPQYPATPSIPQFTQPPQPQPQQQPQPPSYSQQPPVQFQQFLQIQQKFAPPPQVFMHTEITDEDLLLALKHSRFVVSALQFEDIPTAITNLRTALAILTKNPNPQI